MRKMSCIKMGKIRKGGISPDECKIYLRRVDMEDLGRVKGDNLLEMGVTVK